MAWGRRGTKDQLSRLLSGGLGTKKQSTKHKNNPEKARKPCKKLGNNDIK